MATATFKKSDLLEVLDDSSDTLEKVSDEITDNSRWSIHHRIVFKESASGKFYETAYSIGATEQQDESPFEYEPDMIGCEEVRPVQKTITVYEAVPQVLVPAPREVAAAEVEVVTAPHVVADDFP